MNVVEAEHVLEEADNAPLIADPAPFLVLRYDELALARLLIDGDIAFAEGLKNEIKRTGERAVDKPGIVGDH